MLPPNSLFIAIEDQGSSALYEKLLNKTQTEPNIYIETTPAKGPQASILLLTLSAIVVAFTKGFFSKLGEASAEKLIEIFKDIKESQVEPTLISNTSAKKLDGEYSLHHAFYRQSHNGKTIKFVFKKGWNMEQFNSACRIMMNELRLYENNKPNQIKPLIEVNRPISGLYLLSINLDDNSIFKVDIA